MDGSFGSRPRVCFEVEKVIGMSSDGSYQVQWAPAWVSKFHLVGCEHLIEEFLQQQQSEKENDSEVQCLVSSVTNQVDEEHAKESDNISLQSSATIHLYNEDHTEEEYGHTYKTYIEKTSTEGPSVLLDCNMSENNDNIFVQEGTSSMEGFHIGVKIETDAEEEGNEVPQWSESSFSNGSAVSSSAYEDELYAISYNKSDISTKNHKETNRNNSGHSEYNNDISLQTGASTGKQNHICPFCQRNCFDKNRLRVHLRSHSGERPYVCKYCHKGFSQLGNLNQHLLTHTGEKPFTCETCGKSFSRKSHIIRHIRTHTGVKPYHCNNCQVTYSNSTSWKKHMAACSSTM